MRDTHLSSKLQLSKERLFDAFKNEKVEHNLLHTLFSNCEVYFNNTMVYNANGIYPHKAQYRTNTTRRQ